MPHQRDARCHEPRYQPTIRYRLRPHRFPDRAAGGHFPSPWLGNADSRDSTLTIVTRPGGIAR